MTFGALVATIAGEHGLKAAVSSDLAKNQVGHNDQVNESDIAFLTRIAYRYDATAKPVEGSTSCGSQRQWTERWRSSAANHIDLSQAGY